MLRAQRREIRDPIFDGLGALGTFALGDITGRLISLLDVDQDTSAKD
ncbi:hypothetical protein [Streptomyces sp. NPDC058155]